jgi:hypothetical protein
MAGIFNQIRRNQSPMPKMYHATAIIKGAGCGTRDPNLPDATTHIYAYIWYSLAELEINL